MSISKVNLAFAIAIVALGSTITYWHTTTSTAPKYIQANDRYVLSAEEVEEFAAQATAGSAAAAVRLAKFHDMITLDKTSASKWWELAAKQGDVDAQYHMGFLLLEFEGGRRADEGCGWIKLAAQGGSEDARRRLNACGSSLGASAAKR